MRQPGDLARPADRIAGALTVRRLALLLLWPLASPAQPAAPSALSAIEGRVVNAATGEPVAKASLLLVRTDNDWSHNYSGSSDAAGKFVIRDVEPGTYRLRGTRNGFVTIEYGARNSRKTGAVISLEAGSEVKNIELPLTPHGVITGRVLDADGDPLAGAQVQLLRSEYVNGKKMLATIRPLYTNDLGEYRAFGLDPGTYYLFAQNWEATTTPLSTAQEQYAPMYYPGALDAAGAAPLPVAAGATVHAADMMLRKMRTLSVKGRVVVELAGASGIPSVSLSRRLGHDDRPAGTFRTPLAKVNAAGEFEIRDITPGPYTVMASIGRAGRSYGGWTAVDVGGANLENVVVTIREDAVVTGRVRVEGDAGPGLKSPHIRLSAEGPMGAFPAGEGKIADDGTFRVETSRPQRLRASILGLPAGFYLKRVRLGDADVTYSEFDLTGGSLDVLLSPKAATVSGVATGAGGSTVVLVPQEKERTGIDAYYQQTTADRSGRFTFRSVPPGEYKVFAWEDVEDTAWLDPEFLKPVEDKGERVTVGEGATGSVQLTVIPAAK